MCGTVMLVATLPMHQTDVFFDMTSSVATKIVQAVHRQLCEYY